MQNTQGSETGARINMHLQGQMQDLGKTESPDELPPSIVSTGIDRVIPVKRQGNKYVRLVRAANEKQGTEDLWEDISNFALELMRDEVDVDHPDNQTNVRRYVRLVSDETASWEGPAEASDLAKASDFEKFLVLKGDYVWYGTAAEYRRIWHMATQANKESRMKVMLKSIVGHDPSTGVFLAGNGAVSKEGTISLKDDNGIITVDGTHYRMLPKDRNHGGMPVLDFDYPESQATVDFEKVIKTTQQLWGPGVELLWGWGIAHLFRSRWWHACKNFPLCMMPAPPGTGKNSLMTMFVRLYGMPFEPIVIKGMTPTGLFNRVNAYCNIPIWVDEWKNNVNDQLAEMFKSNADGSSKIVGTLDEFQTKSRKHRTGILISGEVRAIDTALNQRYIMVNLRKKESPAVLDEAKEAAEHISAYLVKLLKTYDATWDGMYSSYKARVRKWSDTLSGTVDIRIIENYAKVFSALQMREKDEGREDRFLAYMQEKVTESGNFNPAVEALKFMPRFITGAVGHKGWVSFYVNLKKQKFSVQPHELSRAYCDYSKQPVIATDDLLRYAREARIVHPSQTSAAMDLVNLKLSMGGVTQNRRGWYLNMDNEIVRQIAEELAPFCNRQAIGGADCSNT